MAQDFVAVDLGEPGADARFEPPAAPVPIWQRRALLAALFIFGLIVGVLGWQARVDNAVDIELVAAGANVQSQAVPDQPRLRSLSITMYNGGSQPLTLVGVELPGWGAQAPQDYGQTLASSQWSPVTILAAPTCDDPPPDRIIATVRRDAEDVSMTVPLPAGQEDLEIVRETCQGRAEPVTVAALQSRSWLNARLEESLVTTLNVLGSVADYEVMAISATASGLAGEPAGELPVPMLVGARVDVVWHITDCGLAEQLGQVAVDVTISSVAGERAESVILSDSHLTYMLANYVAREC